MLPTRSSVSVVPRFDTPRGGWRHPPAPGPFLAKAVVWPARRVERSLYERAVGYNYEAVKIFMPANRAKPVIVPYIEHVPPDVTAGVFWLKNRDPQHWR